MLSLKHEQCFVLVSKSELIVLSVVSWLFQHWKCSFVGQVLCCG